MSQPQAWTQAADPVLDRLVGHFWSRTLPGWLERVTDTQHGGFFDNLDARAEPSAEAPKTVLVQARLLFTFAHLACLSGDPLHIGAARHARQFLHHFRKAPGLYRRAVTRTGDVTGQPADAVARSYDQGFVILALSTWHRLCPEREAAEELETCWSAIQRHLRDPATGLLLEDDSVSDPAAPDAPARAQNPHMHLYEALLQAFEMTGDPLWMERAVEMRAIALEHFLDTASGSIIEFLKADLGPLPGRAGERREPGHQCEWAWLLDREGLLSGNNVMSALARRLADHAATHGFAAHGPMQGAARDAVAADSAWSDETFLLWPQTEAIKLYISRSRWGDPHAGAKAQALQRLVFERYFGARPAFANQLDMQGTVLVPEAPSRLLYHIMLALTEGAGAGLWPGPTRYQQGGDKPCST